MGTLVETIPLTNRKKNKNKNKKIPVCLLFYLSVSCFFYFFKLRHKNFMWKYIMWEMGRDELRTVNVWVFGPHVHWAFRSLVTAKPYVKVQPQRIIVSTDCLGLFGLQICNICFKGTVLGDKSVSLYLFLWFPPFIYIMYIWNLFSSLN